MATIRGVETDNIGVLEKGIWIDTRLPISLPKKEPNQRLLYETVAGDVAINDADRRWSTKQLIQTRINLKK